jgi:hypothetical protein
MTDNTILPLLSFVAGPHFHWSRLPGKFVNKLNGNCIFDPYGANPSKYGPAFTGLPCEWYETLIEVIIDNINTIEENSNINEPDYCVITSPLIIDNIIKQSFLFKPDENIIKILEPYELESAGQISYIKHFNLYQSNELNNEILICSYDQLMSNNINPLHCGIVTVLDI